MPGERQRVNLYWMKPSEVWSDGSWLETQLTCFGQDKPDRERDNRRHTYIGNVHQVPHIPEGGQWSWSVTATFPGPRNPFPHSGREPTRKEAGSHVLVAYERTLGFYRKL